MKWTYQTAVFAFAATCLILQGPSQAWADEIESFTEPYRQAAVSAAEVGVISRIMVNEGDEVVVDQPLAQLDDKVLQAALAVARAAKDSTGTLLAAEAEHRARVKQLESYAGLVKRGNASQREYERAVNEELKAAAKLQAAKEELEVRRLEFERAKAQIAQRQIRSPIAGVVISVMKECGEFVSPTDPVVLEVVQLNLLKAVFSIPQKNAATVKVGQEMSLRVGGDRKLSHGKIEFISPTVDPQTGSVTIKVVIDNHSNKVQSGAVCAWDLEGYSSEEQISQSAQPNNR